MTGLNGLVRRGHGHGVESLETEESINRLGMCGGEEFSFGIGPGILGCACDIDRAWSHEGDELMLVDGKRFFAIIEFLIVPTEPVRERGVDASDQLALFAAGEGGAGAA